MSNTPSPTESSPASVNTEQAIVPVSPADQNKPAERPALDPTRYGDWEKNGRCIDF
ncbi:MAG: DUF1674 domain-containing protein [Pseudomonadota bacterium]|nr:DUF1674 domain-containing protein [Pseudomonadota bacterium]